MLRYFLIVLISLLLVACEQKPTAVYDLDGKIINFNEYRGKWLVLNYWADWCNHCVAELPELNKFYAANKANTQMFGVNFDNLSAEQLKLVAKKLDIKFPVLTTDPGKQLGLASVSSIPLTVVIDPRGKVVKTLLGEQSQQALEAAIQQP